LLPDPNGRVSIVVYQLVKKGGKYVFDKDDGVERKAVINADEEGETAVGKAVLSALDGRLSASFTQRRRKDAQREATKARASASKRGTMKRAIKRPLSSVEKRARLARESTKLDPAYEQAMADGLPD